MARHQANSLMLDKYLAYRDLLVSRRDNGGVALNGAQEKYLALMNKIEDGLRAAQRNTSRAQVGGPYLLALDPPARSTASDAPSSASARTPPTPPIRSPGTCRGCRRRSRSCGR